MTKLLLLTALALCVLIGLPAGVIWSLNTLFHLTIPLTFKTWLAALILVGVFNHPTQRRSK